MSPVAPAAYSVTVLLPEFDTQRLPAASNVSREGLESAVAAPWIVPIGGALPFALAANSLTAWPFCSATQMRPPPSTAIPLGTVIPVLEPAIVA